MEMRKPVKNVKVIRRIDLTHYIERKTEAWRD